MNYEKGDRVKFLNDIGGGIITEMKDNKTAIVMTIDGFEMPVPVAELILVEKKPGSYTRDEKVILPSGETGKDEQKGLPDEPESVRSPGIFSKIPGSRSIVMPCRPVMKAPTIRSLKGISFLPLLIPGMTGSMPG
jgi:hypothetical protein